MKMLALLCIEMVFGVTAIGIGLSFVIRSMRGSFSAKRTFRDSVAGIVLGFVLGALALIVGGFSPVYDVIVSCVFGLATTVISCFDPTP
jgi:hypothetical protein